MTYATGYKSPMPSHFDGARGSYVGRGRNHLDVARGLPVRERYSLAPQHPADLWLGVLISSLSVIVGIGGIWAGARKADGGSTPEGAKNGRPQR